MALDLADGGCYAVDTYNIQILKITSQGRRGERERERKKKRERRVRGREREREKGGAKTRLALDLADGGCYAVDTYNIQILKITHQGIIEREREREKCEMGEVRGRS